MYIEYHNIYEQQFEDLAVGICKKILGVATQKFSKGPDGGRDGRFTGTAENYPNESHPSQGKFIIQAKHTDNPIGKLSDSDFYSKTSSSNTIAEELERVKKLVDAYEVDHYILFTNRRDSANNSVAIESEFLKTGLKSAKVYGIDNIDMLLKQYPEALKIADIDQFDRPVRVDPDDLAEIILSLNKELKEDNETEGDASNFNRTNFEDKCALNNVGDETKKYILRNYLQEFYKVDDFLANPANSELQVLYIDTAEEFNFEILERISQGKSLETLLNHLLSRLFYRDGDLKRNKKLTRVVVYYMFWKCDLGVINDPT